MTISSRLPRRGVRLAAVVAAVGLTLAACGSSDSEGDGAGSDQADGFGKLTVQLSWIKNAEFAGEFFADSKGYYKDAGFSSVNLLTGPVAQEEIVATGKADFGLSNAVSTASAVANSDFPLKIVGTTYQKNPFTVLSLADKGNIKTPQDLIGKKIGVQDPNLSLFKALLAANDIDEDEVEIVPNGFDVAPLEDKQIDGLVAYVTNESLLVKGHGFDTVDLPFADNGLPFVAESVMTTDDTIKNEPEKVKAFLEAEIKGWKDACSDLEGGAKLAVEEYGKDIDPPLELAKEVEQAKAQCEDLVVSDETKANGLFTISEDMIAANMKSLKTAGIELEADDLFDMSLLDELLKEKPELAQG
ncbi:ABC transporter substrate-binding protein [Aeromicrobium wangtongii]|uniref:Thiamine pyrimidine synthase n=1 Tax=Aeromicrobium wangtongii TaxID=2969247 RepID=A0ABY5M892_9ACTN|nr:ABC transporter substrate-binding protein [Aeromicrobium wangtongii]MCD9196846.1 ABC transporter substrate-binding protein [Aeromicrobium wangtongii]UUP14355.1 ABC transporter substrate-binding protein [Aeromicrobium wangtongii]